MRRNDVVKVALRDMDEAVALGARRRLARSPITMRRAAGADLRRHDAPSSGTYAKQTTRRSGSGRWSSGRPEANPAHAPARPRQTPATPVTMAQVHPARLPAAGRPPPMRSERAPPPSPCGNWTPGAPAQRAARSRDSAQQPLPVTPPNRRPSSTPIPAFQSTSMPQHSKPRPVPIIRQLRTRQ
jgi:hypothetical protein